MNCETLNSAAQILEAFRACKNAGEEIDLFECLATRPDPPVSAFVEILQKIKLEPVLALTLQAFGKITDADVMQRLKQSDDLLIMLSEQARSGSTDLIRWAAATTIDKLGFDFIAVSQHLSEEPRSIAEKIMQSKMKRFADQNLVESNDDNEFLRFWTYGYWYKLKELTLGYDFWRLRESKKERRWQDSYDPQEIQRPNKFSVCWKVMQSLSLRGLNEINLALQKAEECGENASEIDENEIFEGIAQVLSANQLTEINTDTDFQVLINTQFHCLESNNKVTRLVAAERILSLEEKSLAQLTDEQRQKFHLIEVFLEIENCEINNHTTYKKLETLSKSIDFLEQELKRKKVRSDVSQMKLAVLDEIKKRKSRFYTAKLSCEELRESANAEIDEYLNQIKSISTEIYEKIFEQVQLDELPILSVDNDNAVNLFENYKNGLKDKLSIASSATKQVLTFDSKLEKCYSNYDKIKKNLILIESINYKVYRYLTSKDGLIDIELPDSINYYNYTKINLPDQYSSYLKNKLKELRDEVKNCYEELIPRQLLPLDTEIKELEKNMGKAKKTGDGIMSLFKIFGYIISIVMIPWTLMMMIPVGLLMGIMKLLFGDRDNIPGILVLGVIVAPGMLPVIIVDARKNRIDNHSFEILQDKMTLSYQKLKNLKNEETQILNLLSI